VSETNEYSFFVSVTVKTCFLSPHKQAKTSFTELGKVYQSPSATHPPLFKLLPCSCGVYVFQQDILQAKSAINTIAEGFSERRGQTAQTF